VSEFSGVVFPGDCKKTFDTLSMGKSLKWIIYKINDSKTKIEVEESSPDPDYAALRKALLSKTRTTRGNEKPDARYAILDLEHDVGGGEGKRSRIVFIVWIPDNAETAVSFFSIFPWRASGGECTPPRAPTPPSRHSVADSRNLAYR
jgi:cofilin